MRKVILYFKKMSFFDFVRRVINSLCENYNPYILNKIKSFYHFKNFNIKLGKNVQVYGQVYDIKTGSNNTISSHSIFEFNIDSKFIMGNNCFISYGVIISCRNEIVIGNDVLIGEFTSIRDSTHDYTEKGKSIKNNEDIKASIKIGNNVWIGKGCIVFPGTIIEDGVVVGANSLIKGKLDKNSIYAGNPIRKIKSR